MFQADIYLDGRRVAAARLVLEPVPGRLLRLARGLLVRVVEVVECVDEAHSGHLIVRTEVVKQ